MALRVRAAKSGARILLRTGQEKAMLGLIAAGEDGAQTGRAAPGFEGASSLGVLAVTIATVARRRSG